MISQNTLQEYFAVINGQLQNGVIPFWLERSWDNEYGGFLTNFDADGQLMPNTEKYLNTQARLVWWFSTLSRRYPERSEFIELARKGADFMIQYFWDNDYEGWYWKVERDGTLIDDGKVLYGQVFAIYALSEFILAAQEERSSALANRTFDLLQIHCADTRYGGYYENLERDWTVAPGGFFAGDRKGLDSHMHTMEAFTVLYAATKQEIHRRKLAEVVDVIVDHMLDPHSGSGRNQFDLAFNPIPAISIHRTWNAEREGESPEIPIDTTSYGHNIELAWLLTRAIEVASIDNKAYHQVRYRLVEHAYTHGVDWEFGGIYRDGIASGDAIILEKEFWQNAEALVGFLDAYEVYGEKRFFEAFENIWQFVDKHMINHAVGECRTLLTREGQPIDDKIGNPWKVAYHSGRSLLECATRLEHLSEMAG